MDVTTVIDCTGANLAAVDPPAGVLMAGYATGTGDVPWSDAQFAQHPNAVRIDQSPLPVSAGLTADLIDVEQRAVPISGVAARVVAAQHAWKAAERPGQRWPAVYVEESELTPVANALNAAGITSGVNLWLSKPMPEHAAIDLLQQAGGPFPIVGVQYAFQSMFDVSVVSTAWLNDVSKAPVNDVPGRGVQAGWKFCHKCQGLFWGAGEAQSVCPRGAQHDGSHSHEYTLGFAR